MDKLLQFIQTLRGIFGEVSIRTLLEIVDHLFKIGPPPDLNNETSLRHWLQGLLPVLDMVSELTPTELDDQAVVLVRVGIEDDEAWRALYGLLTTFSDGRVETSVDAKALAAKAGLDIATIMAIVEMIMKIIEMLRR